MGITEIQRQDRKNHLGSSDMPAIMGYSRFGNSYDVWLQKTNRVQPKEKTQDYIQAGNLFEAPVIQWLSEYLKTRIMISEEYKVEGTPIIVHPDAQIVETQDPVEVKTEGLYGPIIEPWGEVGTDEVPEYTMIQTQCHMMALKKEICHIPTFLGGRGFGYFFTRRDERLQQIIRQQAIMFWEEHVLKDVPPENCAPTLAMAKQIRHVEGEPKALDEELIQHWLDAKERKKEFDNQEEYFHAAILADLDGVEMGTCGLGDITNFEQQRTGYEVKPTSFRVLRLKKRK
ncbi:MAG: YqaJ viral recombinase family protein [candidate division Zixibacteria bacterium]|nr:YqaJ viral recombinase family protein [candidate division Zixibacteria bacterium]